MKVIISRWKYFFVCLVSIGLLSSAIIPAPAYAADDGSNCVDSFFLGFPAWYNGLTVQGTDQNGEPSCDIQSPTEVGGVDKFIWRIVFNVVVMLLLVAGYAAVAFIIYGGYKYMISAGSPDGMVAARKTIMNAVIGLAISIAAVAIVRTVSSGLGLGG